MKKSLDRVFIKKEAVLEISKKEFIWVPPFIGKKSLYLRTRLLISIENKLKLCKLKKLFSYHYANRIRCSVINIPLRKRSSLTLFTDIHVVTARLFIIVKRTTIFY